jgi:hypothetical protein
MKIPVSLLPPLEQHSVNVPLQMVDGEQRFLQCEGQRFRKADTNEQGARQSRPLRDRDGIDGLISLSSLGQRLSHHRNDRAQMLARGEFRNHPPIRLMSGNLRRDHVRKNLLSRAHHRRPRLVTGAFDAQDVSVRHNKGGIVTAREAPDCRGTEIPKDFLIP